MKAAVGYGRTLKKVREGVTSRNRKGPEPLFKARFRKLVGSQKWFHSNEEEEDPRELDQ